MAVLPKSVEKVIQEFERLPGIGPKSAARMAYFFLRAPKERSEALANSLMDMKEGTVTCTSCFNVSDSSPCQICSDKNREQSNLCVVEEPLDVVALEKSGVYSGVYFVLGGSLSPADGIGPEQLRMKELRLRVKGLIDSDSNDGRARGEKRLEVLIATNPSLEGEATASYILEILEEFGNMEGVTLEITRLARGLPTGADLEYADRLTLKRAIEGRTSMKS